MFYYVPSEFLQFCGMSNSSITWHQRRMDDIFVTIDYKKREHSKQIKDIINYILPMRNYICQCIELVIFP